ncbi:MAG: hypothetical protein WBA13_16280 [Microcoleaceae cyanobacterium]
MVYQLISNLKIPLYLSGVIIMGGYTLAGWLLAAFNTPLWVWFGTVLIILYLANSGIEALVIANAWIVLMMFLVTVFKYWPEIWPSRIPQKEIALWSMTIMLVWVLGILLVTGLALTHKVLKLRGFTAIQRFSILVSLTGLGLGGGWLIFQAKII